MNRRPLRWYRLSFPRDLQEDAVIAALSSLSGMSPGSRLVLDVVASEAGIEHRLAVSPNAADVVTAELRAAGGLRLDELPEPAEPRGLRLRWQLFPAVGAIRVDSLSASTASLLSGLYPLRGGELVRLRWRLRSARRPNFDATSDAQREGRARALHAKLAMPGLSGYGELLVCARSRQRTGLLATRTASVLRGLSTPFGQLVADTPTWGALFRVFGWRGGYFSAAELTAVIGWPIGSPEHLPGLQLGAARRLLAGRDVPQEGRLIGQSNYPGMGRPVALPVSSATRHTYLLGPTGTGKTSLITNLIAQDMAAGRGLCVVDTNGDLAQSLLDLVPSHRISDVVYLDPADTVPVGLNPLLVGAGANPDLVADQLVELFHRVWQSFWGPRSAQLFHLGLATLAHQPDATLVDLTRLFTDPVFRRQAVGRLDDPVGLGAGWAWFETVSERERLNMLGPVFNKVWALTARRSVRGVLGQAQPRITLTDVLADQRILIVNLAKGILGGEVARLFGALVVTGLWQAATERASLAAAERPVFMAYLDELQDLLAVPVPFDEMLSQGRKYGLALNVAHQNLGQLTTDVRDAILANAHSKLTFRLESGDARVMARSFEPLLAASDLQDLGAYEVAAIVATEHGSTARPVTVLTSPPPPATGSAARVLVASRRAYGRPAGEVEAALRARQARPPVPSGPVGRVRRSS
jgi:hypothetical protein